MAETSKIEWTSATWNVAVGCHKVSAGCTNCYMYDYMRRYGRDPRVVTRTSPGVFQLPLRKDKTGAWKIPDGARVFTSSLTDFFHEDIDAFRDEAWAIIRQRPGLTFQVLTKRIERVATCLPSDWGDGYPNVWLGATVENQEAADARVLALARVPARVRFLSMEPLLGPVDLPYGASDEGDADDTIPGIDWVIVGGESGHGARPMHPDWARSVRDQCVAAAVPFLFKQWGEWLYQFKVGKRAAGRLLDGRTWDEFPGVSP